MAGHAVVYIMLGLLGMRVALVDGNVSPIWFPSGYALAVLLVRGTVQWPSVALATMALTRTSGLPWDACIVIGAGNALGAVLACRMTTARRGFEHGVRSIRDWTTLVVAGVLIAAPIASSIGVVALTLNGALETSKSLNAWFIWTVGDALGILTVTPLVVGATRGAYQDDLARARRRPAEMGALALALGLAVFAATSDPAHFSFLLFAVVFWAALRVGQLGVAVALVATVAATLLGSVVGHGPMVGAERSEALAWFSLTIGSLAIGGYLAAAAAELEAKQTNERAARLAAESQASSLRRARRALAASEHRLQLALNAARMVAWEWRGQHGLRVADGGDEGARAVLTESRRAAVAAAIGGRHGVAGTVEVPVDGPEGRQWIEVRWRDIGDEKDQLVVGVCADVTERRLDRDGREDAFRRALVRARDLAHVADDERRARSVAEGATEQKSAFVAALSHEVRNPLAVIRGFTELLLRGDGGKDNHRAWLEAIDRNAHLMAQLVDDVLDLSKVEAGLLDLSFEGVDLARELRDLVAVLTPEVSSKGLAVRLQLDPDLPILVETDARRLRQILLNLFTNAAKFTETGAIDVVVETQSSPTGSRLRIAVIDTGIGIAAEHQERIFEPFRQADASTSRRFGGTGLGLALARRLASALGGTLRLEHSTPGRGSAFALELPLVTPKPQSVEWPVEETRHCRRLDGLEVLVVDDLADNQYLFKCVLDDAGASTDTVGSGREAIALAAERPYAIILMDIQMPQIDGYAALRAMRRQGLSTPVVALTANALESERARALAAGFDAYLTKPLGRDQLVAAVDEVRRRRPSDS